MLLHNSHLQWFLRKSFYEVCSGYSIDYLSLEVIDSKLSLIALSPRIRLSFLAYSNNMVDSNTDFDNFLWQINFFRDSDFGLMGGWLSQSGEDIAAPGVDTSVAECYIVIAFAIDLIDMFEAARS